MESNLLHPDQEEVEAHLTKNRIVAVDIARILAAVSVMFAHLSCLGYGGAPANWIGALSDMGIGTVDAIFFAFAGYFACRNITWKKAFVNAWWIFVSYLIWNGIAFIAQLVITGRGAEMLGSVSGIVRLLGMGQLLPGCPGTAPVDGPLWFVRDLIFLFLLSPVLYRLSMYIFPFLFICSLLPQISVFIHHSPADVLSLYALYFFTLGCFCRSLPREKQQRLLRFYSPFIILTYWGCIVCLFVLNSLFPGWSGCEHTRTPLVVTMGLWVLYQISRWIEVKSPLACKLALKFEPVTFLTFASHWIIWIYLPDFFRGSKLALVMPFVDFALMSLLFFSLKKWCRPLLHPLAHYKLRPDDFAPNK